MSATDSTVFQKLRHAVRHALTEHDKANSRRKYYNVFALSLYMEALQSWEKECSAGGDPVSLLPQFFTTVKDDGVTFCIPQLNKAVKPFRA